MKPWLCIGCRWMPRALGDEAIVFQLLDLVKRLRGVHPAFAEFALVRGPGPRQALSQLPIEELSLDQWGELFDAERERQGVISVMIWNKRPQNSEPCAIHIKVSEGGRGGAAITDLPGTLCDLLLLRKIFESLIAAFGADEAECYMLGDHFQHWLFWLRDGLQLPGLENGRLEATQGNPSLMAPLLNGTLYIWPEFQP
jgi:hypothetical protein